MKILRLSSVLLVLSLLLSISSAKAQDFLFCTMNNPCYDIGNSNSTNNVYTWDLEAFEYAIIDEPIDMITSVELKVRESINGFSESYISFDRRDYFSITISGYNTNNMENGTSDSEVWLDVFLFRQNWFNLLYANTILQYGELVNYFEEISEAIPTESITGESQLGGDIMGNVTFITRASRYVNTEGIYTEYRTERFEVNYVTGENFFNQRETSITIDISTGLLISGFYKEVENNEITLQQIISLRRPNKEKLIFDFGYFGSSLGLTALVTTLMSIFLVGYYIRLKRKTRLRDIENSN